MKPKAYVFAGLAIVCGLGASYMTSRLLAERTPDEPERVNILVAKRTINVGERVTKAEDMFEVKPVLKENEPPDAIKDFDAIKGKTMRSGRNRGDHITAANLYDKDQVEIPEGHQAVGLPVNLATTAHGLATLPGSRVNLILTARAGNNSDPNKATARVLLHNVLVLAADGRTTREGDQIAPAQVVTFALSEKDALRVTLAKTLGELSLSLRKLNDSDVPSENMIITGAQLLDPNKKEIEKKVEPAPAVIVKETTKPEAPVEEPKDIRSFSIGNGTQNTTVRYERLANGENRDVDGQADAPPPPPVTPRPRQQPQPQRPQQEPRGGSQSF